jgi:ribosomal protein S18 acetylase RimI-like enzyme
MPLPEMIRIPEDDYEQRRKLLSEGWREIEVLETYEGDAGENFGQMNIRSAEYGEIIDVAKLAFNNFKEDRAHSDPSIPPFDASLLKAVYAGAACIDDECEVYVHAMTMDPPNAFISVSGWGEMVVDLIAVDPSARRGGIAASLINHAAWVRRAKRIRAGTQMHNEAAKKLYESLGMVVVKRERTFHR